MYRLSMDIAKNGDSKNMVTFRAARCKDVPQQEAGRKCCERYVLALRKSRVGSNHPGIWIRWGPPSHELGYEPINYSCTP